MSSSSLTILLVLFEKETNSTAAKGLNTDGDFCPAFDDGNPNGIPCDCPEARRMLLGETGLNLCYLRVCPVREVIRDL